MQRVRFRRLIISLGLASMLSLLLLSGGVFAQSANGIDASAGGTAGNDWASADADVAEAKRTIKVTVNDPDVNVPGVIMEGEEPNDDGGAREKDRTGTAYTAPDGDGQTTFYTDNFPIADRDGDGIVNANDVTVQLANGEDAVNVSVLSVGANDGIVTVRSAQGAASANQAIRLVFNAATYNDTTDADGDEAVVVSSSRTRAGIPLRLTEQTATGAANKTVGLYSATFVVSDTQPDDYVDGGGYSTFDEVGVGVNLNGPAADLGEDAAVAVRLYAAAYLGQGQAFRLANDADNQAVLFSSDTAMFPDTAADDATTSATAIALTGGTWNEADFETAVDLNGNSNATDTAVAVAFYEAHYNTDLNGDGDQGDAVTVYNATLFPGGKRPVLLVSESDQVTVTYNDLNIVNGEPKRTGGSDRDTVRIESEAPGASSISPVAGTNTTARSPRLTADVTDGDSGVVKDSIEIWIFNWNDDGDNKVGKGEVGSERAKYTTKGQGVRVSTLAISGGYSAAVTLQPDRNPEVSLAWQVIAEDTAGNRLESSFAGLRIDNVVPRLNAVYTGHAWNTAVNPAVNNPDAGVRTSVRVEFTEGLDPASVDANDFRVDGAVPMDADALGNSVYLTVPEQAPDNTPVVALAGDVADRAGNILRAGPSRTSEDGINPKVTVALDKTLTNDEVGITITTDEDIAGAPSVMTRFKDASGNVQPTVVFGLTSPSARTWTTTIAKNETAAGTSSGRINVMVTASDSIGNKGAAGNEGDGSARGSITYQLDRYINGGADGAASVAPTFVVSGDDASTEAVETSQTNPFVRIVFDQEAKKEYDGDTNSMVTLTSLTVAETPVGGAKGDAGDAMGLVIRRAANEFVLPLLDLTTGSSYEVSVNAEDAAGNTYAAVQKSSFKVVARPGVTIQLQPGMNLVSFPEIPAEPGINEVFPAGSGVDVVLSYDPALDVPWLISQRNAEGVFGEDAEIQSVQVGRAYWVQTGGFNDIKYASRPFLDPTQVPPPVPPVVAVLGGESNLIGFISLTGADSVDADDYFKGVSWQVAYTFDPSSGWAVLRPGGEDTVDAKKGYIVFASKDGWVTP